MYAATGATHLFASAASAVEEALLQFALRASLFAFVFLDFSEDPLQEAAARFFRRCGLVTCQSKQEGCVG